METIDIDFVGCLTRNNFLDEKDPNINIKAKLCLRLLLFLDSLHDFGDKSRTNQAKTDTVVKEKIMKKLLIKLLKDLKWILTAAPNTTYLTMLKEFITNMFNETTEQLNINLKIYSIFFGSGNWPDQDRPSYNDIHQMMQQAHATGKVVAWNKYFSLIKETSGEAARLYFYPTYIGKYASLSKYSTEENINPEAAGGNLGYEHNIVYGIRCLFMLSNLKGAKVKGDKELHQNTKKSKFLHSFVNQLMNYIYQDPDDENEKYIIFIIACLIYFWEPDTNVEGDDKNPHKYIQYDNIELGYVHDLFFQYIINYSLNCFTIIPTSNHNITAGAWQFMTSILQYLCFQRETNQGCQGQQQELYKRSLAKGNNYNLNTFFNQKVSVIIDAAGKPRSINYLTQCFIDIFKEPSKTVEQQFVLYNTSASKFDSAGVSNLETSMKQVDKGLVNETEYTKNYVFNIKCKEELIITIGFIHDAISGKFSVVFKQFFSDTFDNPGIQVSQDFSSLTKSIERFGVGQGDTKNNIYFLIAKSMGDFGQILFYYLLQERSGYFNGNLTSLTIFHTLDTWAASICSLFAAGVICEESSDAIKIDKESDLPYKYGNNKMFVSKHLRDQLLQIMTPAVYLPSINAFNDDIDVWSLIPLTPAQAQQCNKRENLLKKEIISQNETITLLTQERDNLKIQLDEAHSMIHLVGGTLQKFMAQAMAHPGFSADVMAEGEAWLQKAAKLADPARKQKLQADLTDTEDKLNEKAKLVEEQITQPSLYGPGSEHYYMDEPATKKPKLVGGVMTRAMQRQMEIKQQQLNNDITDSFQVLDDQILESRNYIVEVTNWLTQHGIQLSPEYLHPAQKFINNVDNYEPVAARTRSKLLALNQTSTVAAARREVKAVSRQDRLKATVDPEKARRGREEATKGIRATKKGDRLAKLRQMAGGKLTRKHYKSKNPKNMEKIFKNLKI